MYLKAIEIGERIKAVRTKKNISREKLGQMIGVSGRTIVNYENGEGLPAAMIFLIAEKLSVDPNWLFTGEGDMFLSPLTTPNGGYTIFDAKNRVIPHKGGETVYLGVLDARVSAGYGIENFEVTVIDEFAIERRLLLPYAPERCKVLQVKGDSMYPTLHEGDWIVVVEGVIDTNGIYVLNRGGQLFVKRLEFRLAQNTLVIKSDNPNYSPEEIHQEKMHEHFSIIGRVILHIHPSR
ncbi:XRE family transcriptional regulator [Thermospira aquatica]|uniref:Helix-turn-helix transcriptional regulator n=1 Tax=Thermospira aquatica TaxID=2828656 RepID=A0AAX3BE67_9SPIR|nr:S24 family peptidase [Thermospira aquatica]URA10521.1 helix-turn-helix transcriptional regulator [Thermospira aquatica]